MNQVLISAKNVTKIFSNGYRALSEVSFEIYEKEFVVLAGKNGSGKSLLARTLSGLESGTSGDVVYRGVNIFKKPKFVLGKVGVIFQDADSQILGETVYDDVAIGPSNLRLNKEEIDARTERAIQWAHLVEKKNRHPFSLSGGEKRRLAIAGMLAMDCEFLIFDEPFANLDYPSVCNVLESLVQLKSEGKTVLVITHELDKVLAYADRILILNEGMLVEDAYCIEQEECSYVQRISYEQYGIRNPFIYTQRKQELTWLN